MPSLFKDEPFLEISYSLAINEGLNAIESWLDSCKFDDAKNGSKIISRDEGTRVSDSTRVADESLRINVYEFVFISGLSSNGNKLFGLKSFSN